MANLNKKQKQVYKFIEQAYKDNNQDVIKSIEIMADIKDPLPEALEDVLKTIQDNPIKEPELYIVDNIEEEFFNFSIKVSEKFGLIDDEFEFAIWKQFLTEAYLQVHSLSYKNGLKKSTEAIKGMKMPTMSSFKEVQKAEEVGLSKVQDLKAEFEAGAITEDVYVECLEKFTKDLELESLNFAEKSSGLDFSKLHKWEQKLVREITIAHIRNAQKTPFGRSL